MPNVKIELDSDSKNYLNVHSLVEVHKNIINVSGFIRNTVPDIKSSYLWQFN